MDVLTIAWNAAGAPDVELPTREGLCARCGADLHTYLAARRDAVQQNTLDTNFRSNTDLVAAVGQLFARDDAFVQTGIQMPAVHAAAAPGRMRCRS